VLDREENELLGNAPNMHPFFRAPTFSLSPSAYGLTGVNDYT
jgi:hypothetical protein